ncbi:MAG: putative ABC transporter permease [Faecalibacterium sp.]
MNLNFYTLCVIYLVYSFLGWVGETVVATAKGRRFTNRGVASGPFCFVYGTAGVLITIGLNDQRTSLAALFLRQHDLCHGGGVADRQAAGTDPPPPLVGLLR